MGKTEYIKQSFSQWPRMLTGRTPSPPPPPTHSRVYYGQVHGDPSGGLRAAHADRGALGPVRLFTLLGQGCLNLYAAQCCGLSVRLTSTVNPKGSNARKLNPICQPGSSPSLAIFHGIFQYHLITGFQTNRTHSHWQYLQESTGGLGTI